MMCSPNASLIRSAESHQVSAVSWFTQVVANPWFWPNCPMAKLPGFLEHGYGLLRSLLFCTLRHIGRGLKGKGMLGIRFRGT